MPLAMHGRGCAWQRGHAWQRRGVHDGGMHGRGTCVAGWGHVWQAGHMCWGVHDRGACVVGGMHGRGHAWQGSVCGGECIGGMHATCHAWQGVCMAEGTCMAEEGCAWWGHAWQERQLLQCIVRIRLECILVRFCIRFCLV